MGYWYISYRAYPDETLELECAEFVPLPDAAGDPLLVDEHGLPLKLGLLGPELTSMLIIGALLDLFSVPNSGVATLEVVGGSTSIPLPAI